MPPDEILDELTDDATSSTDTAPTGDAAPAPLTKADLEGLGEKIGASLAKELAAMMGGARPAAGPGSGSGSGAGATKPASDAGADDWEANLTKKVAAHVETQVLATQAPMLAAQIADAAAKGFDPEVRAEVAREIAGLPARQLANILNDPSDMRKLTRLARGIHAEREAAKAPASSPTGNRGSTTTEENTLATKFWNDYRDVPGFTKEMARSMAKDALGDE